MQLPKVILKVKAAAGGCRGLLSAVQPRGGVGGGGRYFLLASFCIPSKIGLLLPWGMERGWRCRSVLGGYGGN